MGIPFGRRTRKSAGNPQPSGLSPADFLLLLKSAWCQSLMLWAKHCHIPVVICSIWCKFQYATTPQSYLTRSSRNTWDCKSKVIPMEFLPASFLCPSFPCPFFPPPFRFPRTFCLPLPSRAKTRVADRASPGNLPSQESVDSGQRKEEHQRLQ